MLTVKLMEPNPIEERVEADAEQRDQAQRILGGRRLVANVGLEPADRIDARRRDRPGNHACRKRGNEVLFHARGLKAGFRHLDLTIARDCSLGRRPPDGPKRCDPEQSALKKSILRQFEDVPPARIGRNEQTKQSAKEPGQVAQEQAQIVAGAAQQGVDGIAHGTRKMVAGEFAVELHGTNPPLDRRAAAQLAPHGRGQAAPGR